MVLSELWQLQKARSLRLPAYRTTCCMSSERAWQVLLFDEMQPICPSKLCNFAKLCFGWGKSLEFLTICFTTHGFRKWVTDLKSRKGVIWKIDGEGRHLSDWFSVNGFGWRVEVFGRFCSLSFHLSSQLIVCLLQISSYRLQPTLYSVNTLLQGQYVHITRTKQKWAQERTKRPHVKKTRKETRLNQWTRTSFGCRVSMLGRPEGSRLSTVGRLSSWASKKGP